jgi:hypothetical protein
MAVHDERLQKVLDKLSKDLVEYFDSGFIVATFEEGQETKNAFIKFGNDYGDDDLDDGDLKKIIKDS